MGHYYSLEKSIITIISKVPQNDSMGTKDYQKKFHQNISTLSGTLLLGVIMGHYYSLKKSIISTLSGPAGVFAHSLGSLPLFFLILVNLKFDFLKFGFLGLKEEP